MNQFCLVCWGQMLEFMFCKFSSWLQKFYSPGPHFSKFFLSAVFRLLSDQPQSESWELSHLIFLIFLFFTTLFLEYFPPFSSMTHVAASFFSHSEFGVWPQSQHRESSRASPLPHGFGFVLLWSSSARDKNSKEKPCPAPWRGMCWILKGCTCWNLTRLC